jgi:hypothetical protein
MQADAGGSAAIACTSSCTGLTSAALCATADDCRAGQICHFSAFFGAFVCHRAYDDASAGPDVDAADGAVPADASAG